MIAPDRTIFETLAQQEDLLFLGVAPLAQPEAFERFESWLAEGLHAEMRWIEKHREARRDATKLLPNAAAALVLALPYRDPSEENKVPGPRIARYARFGDYHKVMHKKSERVARALEARFGGQFRVAVDTLPLFEKALAASTGEGFFGKNTLFLHPRYGSFLLLTEILTTLPLTTDTRAPWDGKTRGALGGCGPCTACQVKCPTGALDEAYRLDARRCLSYWTIEHRGLIPEEFWPHMAEYWFGCDLCQDVCPYNQRLTVASRPSSVVARQFPDLFSVATMSQANYEKWFGGTALTRAKRGGLMRNALIALAVTKHPLVETALAAAGAEDEAPVAETAQQLREARLAGRL